MYSSGCRRTIVHVWKATVTASGAAIAHRRAGHAPAAQVIVRNVAAVTAAVEPRPRALDFGDQALLTSRTQSFWLRNKGEAPLAINGNAGQAVYAMAYDGRDGRRRLWAAPGSEHWGSALRSSASCRRAAIRVRSPARPWP